MGNDVLNGRPFEEVAKESSEGPTAYNGGLYDWTTQGSLSFRGHRQGNLFSTNWRTQLQF